MEPNIQALKQEIKLISDRCGELRANQRKIFHDLNELRANQRFLLENVVQPPGFQQLHTIVDQLSSQFDKLNQEVKRGALGPSAESLESWKEELYDLQTSVSSIERRLQQIGALLAGDSSHHNDREPHESISEGTIDPNVFTLLSNIGLPTHKKGYMYIAQALQWIHEDPSLLTRMTPVVYPNIARKYRSTPSRIERAMRHSIQDSWQHQYMPQRFHLDPATPPPGNTEFLAMLMNQL